MTFTATQLVSSTEEALHLNLTLKSLSTKIGEKLQPLLAAMKPHFDQEELAEWLSSFQKHDLETEDGKLSASIELCSLLFDIVTPVLQKTHGLPNFIKEIKAILALTLPQGNTVDGFIQMYSGFEDEAVLFFKEEVMRKQIEQEMTQEVHALANAENGALGKQYQDTKAKLSKMVDEQKSQSRALHGELDAAAAEQAQAVLALSSPAEKMKGVAKEISDQEKEFEALLAQCEDAFKDV